MINCGISSMKKPIRLHQNIIEMERDENAFNPANFEDNINNASISVFDIILKAAKMVTFALY